MSNGAIEKEFVLKPTIVYQPHVKENQIVRFTKYVEQKYNIKINDYFELHEWSYKNYPDFWDCVWNFFEVLHSTPYTQVFDVKKDFLCPNWFEGVRLNFTANILKYRDSRYALIATNDDDCTQYVTYDELYDEVKIYIRALKMAGIQKGDVVGCYMVNKIEPAFAFLATAAIGALWSGCLPVLGVKGVLSRYQQLKPKIIFTSGNFFCQGKEIRMEQKLPEIVSGLPSLERVVFIPPKAEENAEHISRIPKCVFLSEFLKEARKVLEDDSKEIAFEQFPFDYPLCISFTSGTTGVPKCVVHSIGVFMVSLRDYGLGQDLTRGDNVMHCVPVGWISWNIAINCLHLGLTVTLYEGDAFMSSPTRFWDLVDNFGISSAYVNSNTLESMEQKGHVPTEKHSLKTLKQLLAIASPMKPQTFTFLSQKVKINMFFSSAYGCTESYGFFSAHDSNLPVYKGELQGVALGIDLRVLDEEGYPVTGKRGEVVLANPHPGLPIAILQDENKEIIKELYLTKYPGYWNIGDDALINPFTKGIIVYGRSDEAMNPKGQRINCSDIYSALEGFPGLMDSVCVSQFNSSMSERVILFVKMDPSCSLTEEIQEEIKKTIEQNQSFHHVPDVIIQAPDIPYSLIGKKLNGLVKNLVNKKLVKNIDVVINTESIDFYKTLDLGNFS